MPATADTHLDALVASISEARQATCTGITEPSSPQPLQSTLDTLAAVRGRGAFLPFIGTGQGWGPFVQCEDGSVKLDMVTGIGVHGFGHGDDTTLRIMLEAATQDTVMQGNLQCNADAVAFMSRLLEQACQGNSRLAHVFPCCSGAVANENALKVCMQKTGGAPRVLAFAHNFSGRTTTMSQISDSPGVRQGIALNLQVDYLPYEDPTDREGSLDRTMTALQQALSRYPGQHACVVLEPVQGEGGFNPATSAFLRPVLEAARAAGVPVLFDEVQTFGRTEQMFRQHVLGVEDLVDVLTVGKMSQVCATLYADDFNPAPGLLSGTFIGSTAGLRVGASFIERLASGGYYGSDGRIATLHEHFRTRGTAMMADLPAAFPEVAGAGGPIGLVGGCGGMMRLTPFGGDKAKVIELVKSCLDAGVLLFFCGHGPFHLRMLPPVGVLEQSHLDTAMDVIGNCIEAMVD
ncbi:MAG: aminotransferase class III-fold pyridoxal phosphate-dependent enzyme [Phycisphaerales bacterium]|nr:aminotransferase class III-fold pyridoxal phosphate-dependent enzyme [Phycisphaerales bacterium]